MSAVATSHLVQEAGSKLIKDTISRTLAFAEEWWRPRLETALNRITDVETTLAAERQKHQRFLTMANSTARADAETIEGLRAWVRELEDKLGVPRSKVAS